MFAYCLNNPVNAFDPIGEDAIWLQDADLLPGVGHTGLLIQDANGVWYHFYWGSTGTGKLKKEGATAMLHSMGRFVYRDLQKLNEYLNKNNIYDGKYEALIYFEGDFSRSVEYAKSLKRNYNLIYNNCMQVSVEVLLKGTFDQGNQYYKMFLGKIAINPVPNYAYLRLVSFHRSVASYYAAPWYLRWAYVNPVKAVLVY